MARQKGSANIAASLEILAEAPLDARTVVAAKSDLTAQDSFPYAYVGMVVSVKSEGKLYMLTAMDTTDASNWKEIGSGSGSGGGSVDVDDAISITSENPVQNKVIAAALNDKQATILSSIMTIGGVAKATVEDALHGLNKDKQDILAFDPSPSASSTNPVTSAGIHSALANKQDAQLSSSMTIGDATVETIEGALNALNDEKVNTTEVGTANGIAELDSSGKVPASQLPSFVDDVIEGYYKTESDEFYEEDTYTTLIPSESGKIYVDLETNATYRWGGSVYVRVPDGVTLGETSSTAYRGDRGKVAYDFSQTPYDSSPAMNGVASAGESTEWSRGDHVHPRDNTKQDIIQFATLPSPTADNVGVIYQYIGATTADYTNGYFYECKQTDEDVYEWKPKSVQPSGGSGGSGTVGQTITASINVGGIEKGNVFPYGTSYDEMWFSLIDPSVKPTFIEPSWTTERSIDLKTAYAIGETIPSHQVQINYDPGAIMLGKDKQADRAGAATAYKYSVSNSDGDTLFEHTNTTGKFTIPSLTSNKATIYMWATTIFTDSGVQPKDSRGNNYGEPYTKPSISDSFLMGIFSPRYYGVSDTPTISNVSGLTRGAGKADKTYSFTTNNQYMVVVYDASYGSFTSIRDNNGFETISGWNKSSLTIDGISCYVYISKTPTTDTNAKFTFAY